MVLKILEPYQRAWGKRSASGTKDPSPPRFLAGAVATKSAIYDKQPRPAATVQWIAPRQRVRAGAPVPSDAAANTIGTAASAAAAGSYQQGVMNERSPIQSARAREVGPAAWRRTSSSVRRRNT